MLKILLITLLPVLVFMGEQIFTSERSLQPGGPSGTLEKMIVSSGSVTMDLDIARLNGSGAQGLKPTRLSFDTERDSFFSILVFNGELRSPLPGSIAILPKGSADLPGKLGSSYGQLLIERTDWGSDYALIVRDAKSGFVFFNIDAQESKYDSNVRVFRSEGGRLLL